jgi:hypothetical protein
LIWHNYLALFSTSIYTVQQNWRFYAPPTDGLATIYKICTVCSEVMTVSSTSVLLRQSANRKLNCSIQETGSKMNEVPAGMS